MTDIRVKVVDADSNIVYATTQSVSASKTLTFNITDLTTLTAGPVNICVQCKGSVGTHDFGERVIMWWSSKDHIYSDRDDSYLTVDVSDVWQDLDPIKAYLYASATSLRVSVDYVH